MIEAPGLLSVIIPVYNEETTIAEVIEKVDAVQLPIDKEIIVVDDGSTDGTAEFLRSSAASHVTVHHARVNTGKGAAVRIGLGLAKGQIILIQDADLELDPGEYLRLVSPIIEGRTDVVYGSRFLGDNRVVWTRRLANFVLTQISNALFGTRLTDMETAYKAFTADVASKLTLTADRFEIEPEITAQIAKNGFKIVEVPITYRPRTKSEGKKIKWRDGLRALTTLLKQRLF